MPSPKAPRLRPMSLPNIPDYHWTEQGGLLSPTSPTLQVHEILRTSYTPFYYCFAKPPSTLIFKPKQSYTLSTLEEAATTPAIQRMYIEVPASRRLLVPVSNPRGITILDVLTTLYNMLRTPITPSVADDMMMPSSLRHGGLAQPRRSRSDDGVLGNGRKRLEVQRRIQLLHGRTTFAGLEVDRREAGTWVFSLRTTTSP